MKEIITVENNEIKLCTNLDEYSFGKTDYNSIVTQEGFIFDGEGFTPWTFSDVKAFNIEGKTERIVFYCGNNPLSDNCKTLLEFFELGGKGACTAATAVCKAITVAAKDNFNLPIVGAGGILVDISGSTPKLLFVPGDLFKYSATTLSAEEHLQLHAGWVNQTIYDLPALCFERAVIAYRLLTGRLPYDCADLLERNADILDRKFLPLELCINGIDVNLAKEINRALLLNSNAVNVPGKRKSGKDTEDLTPKADFPLELLEPAWNYASSQKQENQEEFQEKVASYIKVRDSKIATKRKLRRNSAAIVSGILAGIALIFMISSTVKSKGDEYTTKGLTSIETLETYFIGVNNKSTTLLTNFVKGKIPQKHVDAVSQVFVISKQRQAYGNDNGFAAPENWLLYINQMENYSRSGVYGVTNLKIDGIPVEPEAKAFKKNQKPAALTKEGNVTLTKKSESVHKVEYYLLHSEGEDSQFIVEKVFEVYTLTYTKDRWLITDITSDYETVPVRCGTFKIDYYNQLALNDGDVLKTADALRGKYPWLPTQTAISKEKDLMEYKLLHPYDSLF